VSEINAIEDKIAARIEQQMMLQQQYTSFNLEVKHIVLQQNNVVACKAGMQ
jgi:CheY-specific phosphatase CheX